MRIVIVCILLLITTSAIAFIFWKQELKYALPTPVPAGYNTVRINEVVDLHSSLNLTKNTNLYLHFFNPDCPCSRFNLKHFNSLTKSFRDKVKVFAVIPGYADLARAKDMISDTTVTIMFDVNNTIAEKCGVYSTPQAVVINASNKLFYRGNYNKSRYCTVKETNYAEIALTALVKGEDPPVFDLLATQSYGCELPDSTLIQFN